MYLEANFDQKHAEVFINDWAASGYTIQQLFFLLLEPYLPGSGRQLQSTADVTDLAYRLALELPDGLAQTIFVAQGILRDPENPLEEELEGVMRLSDFIAEYVDTLSREQRSPKFFPIEMIDEIITMTSDWPKRLT